MTGLPPVIAEALEAGHTLVTPTAQRAAAVRLAWARHQLAASRTVWRSPDVLPFDAWRERCLDRARAHGLALPRTLALAEETLLWMRAADRLTRDGAVPLLQSGALADALRQSARLVADHRIPVRLIAADASDEAAWLARALQWVDQEAAALGATTRWARLQQSDGDPGAGRTWLAGFASLLPSQTTELAAYAARGGDCRVLATTDLATGPPATPAVRQTDDAESELAAAAAWCARQLGEDGRRRLLVVVPELAARRGVAERAFQQQLDAASAWQGGQASDVVAFEGGEPLVHATAVAHALRSLRVLLQPVQREELLLWLRSASHGLSTVGERARLEQRLALQPGTRASLRALIESDGQQEGVQPSLSARVRRACALLPTGAQPAFTWVEAFDRMLAVLRPADAAPRDSRAQQTEQRWRGLLQEYASANAAIGAVDARDAVHQLGAIAQRIRFAPASADAAVTVTASLDPPVTTYDAIWVCGLNSTTWPAPPRIDPFVPWYLQREAAVQVASPAGCLALARGQLDAWRAATPTLVLSYASEDDGAARSPSPLLRPWPALREPGPRAVQARRVAAGAPALESYVDDLGLPWPQARTVPGGARALILQNNCPFRAYAEIQLGASERAPAEEGVDRRQRGDLLHVALEALWGVWSGSDGLSARDDMTLEAEIHRCVQQAANRRLPAGDDAVRRRSVERECARASKLLLELARLEKTRAPFVVAARESMRRLELAGLGFDLRIDRLDRLADGSLAIIDYKSGRTQPRDWFGDRPDIVQLLVYLMALQSDVRVPVTAIATLHLDDSQVEFKGYVRERELLHDLRGLPDPGSDWPDQLTRWQQLVIGLAGRFARGEARVDPRREACRHCALPTLCRKAQWLEADAGLESDPDPDASSVDRGGAA